ncbi:hypothetical protein [Acidiphilium rubrum]|uniref:hypothetical protein n=1 Tax=Acidiphilium rubrum TaxID=526 RepID=UPI002CC18FE3|nr:hypothetical protein [Acidiphilium rubrum]HQT86806.1 hypothetical protein [Acidiphilium rubrum]
MVADVCSCGCPAFGIEHRDFACAPDLQVNLGQVIDAGGEAHHPGQDVIATAGGIIDPACARLIKWGQNAACDWRLPRHRQCVAGRSCGDRGIEFFKFGQSLPCGFDFLCNVISHFGSGFAPAPIFKQALHLQFKGHLAMGITLGMVRDFGGFAPCAMIGFGAGDGLGSSGHIERLHGITATSSSQ